jgi:hypothetical protein
MVAMHPTAHRLGCPAWHNMEPWYLKCSQVDHHLKLNSIMHYMAGEENRDREVASEHPRLRVLELLTRAHEHFTVTLTSYSTLDHFSLVPMLG